MPRPWVLADSMWVLLDAPPMLDFKTRRDKPTKQ